MNEELKKLKSQILYYQLAFESYTDDIGLEPEVIKLINTKIHILRYESNDISEVDKVALAKEIIANYKDYLNGLDSKDKNKFIIYDEYKVNYISDIKNKSMFNKYWGKISELSDLYNIELIHNEDAEIDNIYNKILYLKSNMDNFSEDYKIELAKEILAEFDYQVSKLDNLQNNIYGKGEK